MEMVHFKDQDGDVIVKTIEEEKQWKYTRL